MKPENIFYIYSFYRFKRIGNKHLLKKQIEKVCKNKLIRGTILIANEGINGSISGNVPDLNTLMTFLRKELKIRKFELKKNTINFLPFNKFKIRIKKEIVSLGIDEIDVNAFGRKLIEPQNWDKIVKNKKIKVIDTRNNYEIKIGRFKNSLNPHTKSFREFPKMIKKLNLNKEDTIAMYCTGGIRCEKASAFMIKEGFRNVFQLKGGILNYLNHQKVNKETISWNGECFVFDNRVSVNKNLLKGNYEQCYGCRLPITHRDIRSKYYKKGVYCPNCYSERSADQKRRSQMRQDQIDLKNKKKIMHQFKKIDAIDL